MTDSKTVVSISDIQAEDQLQPTKEVVSPTLEVTAKPSATGTPKRSRGRPKGSAVKKTVDVSSLKFTYRMKNGRIKPEHIFLYIKPASIPPSELDRFLQLVDQMISSLGAESLQGPDIEEIALLYRDRVFYDSIYENFIDSQLGEAGIGVDTAALKQIETLNKQLEVRKENLAVRFKDLGKKREDHASKTMMDLLAEFKENEKSTVKAVLKEDKELEAFEKQSGTDATDYMERHLKTEVEIAATEDGGNGLASDNNSGAD